METKFGGTNIIMIVKETIKEILAKEKQATQYDIKAERCLIKRDEEGYDYYTEYANELWQDVYVTKAWLTDYMKQEGEFNV